MRKLIVLVATLFALLSAATPLRAQSATPPSEADFYYVFAEKVPVSILLDRIGAIARPTAKADAVEVFAKHAGLRVVSRLSGGFYIYALPKPLDRAGLAKLTRSLRAAGHEIFRDVGMVAMVGKETTPSLVSDDLIVQFKPEMSPDAVEAFLKKNELAVAKKEPLAKNKFILRAKSASAPDSLQLAKRLQESGAVVFAQPNFWRMYTRNETIPTDPLFAAQWHLKNTGQSGGTATADSRATFAWDFTMGSSTVVIAIADDTFDIAHEDLAANLYTNPGEIAGNGIDDDGNGFIDDVHGWNFLDNNNNVLPVGAGDNHGTAVTGVAVARANNAHGGTGSCPNCQFVPLVVFNNCDLLGDCVASDAAFAAAITYAGAMHAKIMNNSWGGPPGSVAAAAIISAINTTSGQGTLVLFAGGNSGSSAYCNANNLPALNNVFAISSSTNLDRKVPTHAFGNCIGLLAPTRWGFSESAPTSGTLAITTTDRTGNDGYNNTDIECIGGLTEGADRNYTSCFSGTSSATPLSSGVAGLILSVDPGLTRWQVRHLMQDTADKIEDSLGAYADNVGFSSPVSGIATHSWGRINAFEAVRIAAPVAQGGKGGVDIFMRDNRLDWGNTPSNVLMEPTRGFIGHWTSMDIKVDAPPYQPAPTTSAQFDAFVDETPSAIPGQVNHVYVRVHNRGPVTASTVTVKLHWAQFGTALPGLPADFWTAFPGDSADTTQWHPLGVRTINNLAYSGASAAGCPGRAQPTCGTDLNGDGDTTDPGETMSDAAQVVEFDFPAPTVNPSDPNHFCMFALIDSPQDPISAASRASFVVDNITPNDNNATHRNYHDLPTTMADNGFVDRFFVRNPTTKAIRAVLNVNAPRGWKIAADKISLGKPFPLKPRQQVLVTVKILSKGSDFKQGEVTFTQLDVTSERPRVMGGLTYYVGNRRPPKAQGKPD